MSLKRLSDVSVGSLVKFGGDIYKLHSREYGNFLFQKKVGPFFNAEKQGAGTLISDYDGAESHLVNVVEVASGSQSDLTSQLRKQVSTQSLTESLRAQVEEQDDDDDDDDDYSPSSYAYGYAQPAQSVSLPGIDLEQVKKDSLTANLRSQQAVQGTAQAQLNATIAKAKATGAQASVEYLAEKLEVVDHNTLLLRDDADEESYRLRQVQSQQEDHEYRIAALEEKQFEEENKVSLERELNEKLALQSKFNQATKKQTTGGNGMKNVLGNFKNQFGKVEGKFAFAATGGIALRSGLTNTFVSYDKDAKTLTDVSGLTLKFDVPAFKLPVAAAQVKVGDLIIHNAEFVFVTKKADGYLEVINPEKGVNGSVVPTKNAILNAAFYTVVKTLDAAGGDGFNPLLLMAMSKGESNDSLLPLLLMGGGLGGNAQGAQAGAIDPMMFMLLGDKVDDILPLILMQQGGALGGGAAQGGIQGILPFLLMGDDKSSKDLLPLLMMSGGLGAQGGGQAGAINPLMFLAMGDGDIDPMTLMMMSGGFGGQGGGLFGQAPQAPQAPAQDAPASTDSTDGE